MQTNTDSAAPRPPFGAWLLTQQDGGGLVSQLSAGAAVDRQFPRRGAPDDIRAHLTRMQADGDMFAAVDDAETDWMCY